MLINVFAASYQVISIWYMHYISNTGYININNWETSRINIQKIIKTISQQECIPVGCLPSTAVAVSGGGGGGSGQGGCLPKVGVCPGDVCLRGVSAQVVSARHTVLPLWTEWQTDVKTLPCRNYVADGKNTIKNCISLLPLYTDTSGGGCDTIVGKQTTCPNNQLANSWKQVNVPGENTFVSITYLFFVKLKTLWSFMILSSPFELAHTCSMSRV